MSIEISGIAPLLQVFDMPASLRFYRDILGMKVIQSSPGGDDCGWALLQVNNVELMLNTAYEQGERPDAPDEIRQQWHSDTIIYFGCPDTEALYADLKSKGLDVQPPETTGYGFKALTIQDPDGYQLCFHWRIS